MMQKGLDEENAALRRGNPLQLVLDQVGKRPSGVLPPETPLVQRAMATITHLGGRPSLEMSSTDANIPISRGIPAITIGRGGVGGETHAPGEWWLNRNGHLAIQNALLLLVAEAGLVRERT
jgi:hypothetical protein